MNKHFFKSTKNGKETLIIIEVYAELTIQQMIEAYESVGQTTFGGIHTFIREASVKEIEEYNKGRGV